MVERKDAIVQGLRAQLDLLDTVRTLQLEWAESAENSDAAQLHRQTAESFMLASAQCDLLLDLYLTPSDLESGG